MGHGTRADTLGDGDATIDDPVLARSETAAGEEGMEGPILKEARKGNMTVENSEEAREMSDEQLQAEKDIGEVEVDKLQEAERKGFSEVY
jgi:hypothetical protein